MKIALFLDKKKKSWSDSPKLYRLWWRRASRWMKTKKSLAEFLEIYFGKSLSEFQRSPITIILKSMSSREIRNLEKAPSFPGSESLSTARAWNQCLAVVVDLTPTVMDMCMLHVGCHRSPFHTCLCTMMYSAFGEGLNFGARATAANCVGCNSIEQALLSC